MSSPQKAASEIADMRLAGAGNQRIDWSDQLMPVLRGIRRRFRDEKPLAGVRVGACLHITSETANLMRTLCEGGAQIALSASSPSSTQDEVAASLVADYDVAVFARRGEDTEAYYQALNSVLDTAPSLLLDDGADLISLVHKERPEILGGIRGATEQTTTGVLRLRAMARHEALEFPVIAVNDSETKYLFNNRYGTGQSTLDGIIRATNVLIAGKTVVVVGYGWAGRGVASRAAGLGASVVVIDVAPVRALEALLDGCRVMSMAKAAPLGDIFITATGNKHVISKRHFNAMKDGVIICNCGHFDVELDLPGLAELAQEQTEVRPLVEEFRLLDGRRLYLLGEGRLINFTAAEGHPAAVMDMSFANQAQAVELLTHSSLEAGVHQLPQGLDHAVATLKLESLGIEIEKLTDEQREYQASWEEGT
ncbi:MAG: adenosylhomocysteinase [Acidobacteria bacterium]|nr:adenosylhomocysteinase [Acidobacteriota bacterium]